MSLRPFTTRPALADRIDGQDWPALIEELDGFGCAQTILTPQECAQFTAMWQNPQRFRATIDMARHRFGQGTYRFLRTRFPNRSRRCVPRSTADCCHSARDWAARLGDPAPWPEEFADWLDACHTAGQSKPTPTTRGWSRSPVRHGVSRIRSGHRHTLGLVLHDAQ